jgi:hypothetical protein
MISYLTLVKRKDSRLTEFEASLKPCHGPVANTRRVECWCRGSVVEGEHGRQSFAEVEFLLRSFTGILITSTGRVGSKTYSASLHCNAKSQTLIRPQTPSKGKDPKLPLYQRDAKIGPALLYQDHHHQQPPLAVLQRSSIISGTSRGVQGRGREQPTAGSDS